jgi:hypothetical protein
MFGGPGGMGGMPSGEDNPLWEMIKGIPLDKQNTIQLLFSAPDFVEDDDMKMATKHASIVGRNVVFGTVLGIAANLQLKKIPNFLLWSRFIRYPSRIITFFLPFGIFYPDLSKRLNDIDGALTKYQKRFIIFQRTGNAKYLDPDGVLQKQHMKKLGL